MIFPNILRPLALVLVAGAAVLLSDASAQGEAVPITCRSLCFAHAGSDSELVATSVDPEATVSLTLPRTRPSETFVCGAVGGKIKFSRPGTGELLATGTVPAGVKQALLFFMPKGKEGYRVLVIDESPKAFPPGGVLVCNLYQGDVRFIVGEHRKEIGPGKRVAMARPKQRDDFNMAPVAFQFQQGERWRTTSETKLRFTELSRYLILSYVDPRSKRPRLKTYRDTPPVKLPVPG